MITKEILSRSPYVLITIFCMITIFTACSQKKETETQKKRDHIIVDRLDKAEHYFDMHPAFEKAFTFLRQNNLSELSLGRHEIDGDRLFCKISKCPGRKRTESRLEMHRKYIDIQYVIAGTDEMGWKPASECKVIDVPYNEDRDITYFKDESDSWTQVPAGSFAIFFPQDAHAPLVSDGEIHKVVVKVAVEWDQE